MDIETRGSDFTPFANKIEALLFMMINAPQPIVSYCHLLSNVYMGLSIL